MTDVKDKLITDVEGKLMTDVEGKFMTDVLNILRIGAGRNHKNIFIE